MSLFAWKIFRNRLYDSIVIENSGIRYTVFYSKYKKSFFCYLSLWTWIRSRCFVLTFVWRTGSLWKFRFSRGCCPVSDQRSTQGFTPGYCGKCSSFHEITQSTDTVCSFHSWAQRKFKSVKYFVIYKGSVTLFRI